jgi:hypothetical protein
MALVGRAEALRRFFRHHVFKYFVLSFEPVVEFMVIGPTTLLIKVIGATTNPFFGWELLLRVWGRCPSTKPKLQLVE